MSRGSRPSLSSVKDVILLLLLLLLLKNNNFIQLFHVTLIHLLYGSGLDCTRLNLKTVLYKQI